MTNILIHPNGFLQIPVNHTSRIHVWSGDIPRQRIPTPIHNHRWDFVSRVLIGVMVNVRYNITLDPVGTHNKAKVNRSEANVLEVDNTFRYRVSITGIEYIRAGETYLLEAGEYHESRPQGFCVTTITMTENNNSVETIVMVPVGLEPDNVFNTIYPRIKGGP